MKAQSAPAAFHQSNTSAIPTSKTKSHTEPSHVSNLLALHHVPVQTFHSDVVHHLCHPRHTTIWSSWWAICQSKAGGGPFAHGQNNQHSASLMHKIIEDFQLPNKPWHTFRQIEVQNKLHQSWKQGCDAAAATCNVPDCLHTVRVRARKAACVR